MCADLSVVTAVIRAIGPWPITWKLVLFNTLDICYTYSVRGLTLTVSGMERRKASASLNPSFK